MKLQRKINVNSAALGRTRQYNLIRVRVTNNNIIHHYNIESS